MPALWVTAMFLIIVQSRSVQNSWMYIKSEVGAVGANTGKEDVGER